MKNISVYGILISSYVDFVATPKGVSLFVMTLGCK